MGKSYDFCHFAKHLGAPCAGFLEKTPENNQLKKAGELARVLLCLV